MRLIFGIMCFSLSIKAYAQDTITAGTGIKGIDITINTSDITDVTDLFGDTFIQTINHYAITYSYPKQGVSFTYNPYDKNKIIRSITLMAPFKAVTQSGVVLNETTWQELDEIYHSKGGFTGKDYAYKLLEGISFYIPKNSHTKGWNTDAVINKIEIHNRNQSGIANNVGYIYDTSKVNSQVSKVVAEVSEHRTVCLLIQAFKDNYNALDPFAIQYRLGFERALEWGILQTPIKIIIGKSEFGLALLSRNDTLFHCRLLTNDSVIFNRRDSLLLTQIVSKHNLFYNTSIDVENEIEFPLVTYVHGYNCGFVGHPPAKYTDMYNLVVNRNYDSLKLWLSSMNPEIQAYGLEGMYRLAVNGVVLSDKDRDIIRHVSNLRTDLIACSGCEYGVRRRMSDVLTKKELKHLFKIKLEYE